MSAPNYRNLTALPGFVLHRGTGRVGLDRLNALLGAGLRLVTLTRSDDLYSYTTDAGDLPRVTSDNTMNTGLAPFYFAQGNNHGVYIGNSGTLGIWSADGFLIAS
jgi:hypothetical protein